MMKKTLSILLVLLLALALAACGSSQSSNSGSSESEGEAAAAVYKVGICNYVSHASLDQIAENLQSRLQALAAENGVEIQVFFDNCNADANVLSQIISNFQANEVDLMIGIATPVAMAMQAATEGSDIPVVFSAVSDPVGTGLVASMEAPGANLTGTSDYLDTASLFNLIFAADPEADLIGLLYDNGQDASTTAIREAKEYLYAKGVAYI